VADPPPTAKSIFSKKIVWPLGVARPTQGPPFGRGVASATLDRLAFSHPHGQTAALGGGPATHPKGHLKKKKKKQIINIIFLNIKKIISLKRSSSRTGYTSVQNGLERIPFLEKFQMAFNI
jgi:hypothetical protein